MRSLKNQVIVLSVIIIFLVIEGITLVGLQHLENEKTKIMSKLLLLSEELNHIWRLEEKIEGNLPEIMQRYGQSQYFCIECHSSKTDEFDRHVGLVKKYAQIAAEKDKLNIQSAVALNQLSVTFNFFTTFSNITSDSLEKLNANPQEQEEQDENASFVHQIRLLIATDKLASAIFDVYGFAMSKTRSYYIGEKDTRKTEDIIKEVEQLFNETTHIDLKAEERESIAQMVSSMQELLSIQDRIDKSNAELKSIETELATNREELSGVISKVVKTVDNQHKYISAFVNIFKVASGVSIVLVLFWYLKGMIQLQKTVSGLTAGITAIKNDYGYRIRVAKCFFSELAEVVYTINDLAREVEARDESLRQANDRLSKEIAEREGTEKRLRFLTNAVEHSPASIVLTDSEGNIQYVNPKFTEVTGYTYEEAIGQNPRILSSGHHNSEFYRQLWEMVKAGKEWQGEFCNKKKNGTLYWELASISPILDDTGKISNFVAIKEDITEKKKAEHDMLLLDKLRSLGVLAGGIAHDFNNLLTGIIGNISLASLQLKDNPELKKRLDEVLRAAERGTGLSSQLLVFAKGGEPVKKAFNIERLVRDISDFVLSGSSVTSYILFAPRNIADRLWCVDGDKNLISQCISNIILNAKQAMHGKGKIEITISNAEFDADDPFLQGKFIKMTIADNGPGMSEDVVTRIFEPYFTTKEAGSGLGLAVVRSIVQKHGGVMLVSSRLGFGTTFTIYLPASEAMETETQDVSLEELVSCEVYRQARVLVMDDEEQIAHLCVDALENLGHEAVSCHNGEEAIRLYQEAREAGNPFDLIIMDLTIVGGMGGIEACQRIKQIYPDAKLIVSSGYSKDPAVSSPQAYGFSGVLPKPYKIHEMEAVIKSVLAKS